MAPLSIFPKHNNEQWILESIYINIDILKDIKDKQSRQAFRFKYIDTLHNACLYLIWKEAVEITPAWVCFASDDVYKLY